MGWRSSDVMCGGVWMGSEGFGALHRRAEAEGDHGGDSTVHMRSGSGSIRQLRCTGECGSGEWR